MLNVRMDEIRHSFHDEHNRQFGYELRNEATELEIINVRLRAIGVTEKPPSLSGSKGDEVTSLESAIKGKRPAYIPEVDAMREVTVYDGERLTGQIRIKGPAIIEQVNTTIFLGESYDCETGIEGAIVVFNKCLLPEGFTKQSKLVEMSV